MVKAEQIAAAFTAACRAELDAPKPGNVHIFADGHRMKVADFVASADAAAPFVSEAGLPVGERILGAVAATLAATGQNTNLGIVLLCAPLAAAAECRSPLEQSLATVLDNLGTGDASHAFRAIALAAPGGLGTAERHDVRQPPVVTLLQAMHEAAGRDSIAAQYANGFAEVFTLGMPALRAGLARWHEPRWATLAAYLAFLRAMPDSHILRKYGAAAAGAVQSQAGAMADRLAGCDNPEGLLPGLLAWDTRLKDARLNPGTSADLTVATLFAHRLLALQQSA